MNFIIQIFGDLIEKFETLEGVQKLAVSLLLFNSVLFSSLINIIFVFYGDYLIKKFNIEDRFPNLTNIINLRRKFSKYYFILNCLFILGVIIAEVLLCLAILSI